MTPHHPCLHHAYFISYEFQVCILMWNEKDSFENIAIASCRIGTTFCSFQLSAAAMHGGDLILTFIKLYSKAFVL